LAWFGAMSGNLPGIDDRNGSSRSATYSYSKWGPWMLRARSAPVIRGRHGSIAFNNLSYAHTQQPLSVWLNNAPPCRQLSALLLLSYESREMSVRPLNSSFVSTVTSVNATIIQFADRTGLHDVRHGLSINNWDDDRSHIFGVQTTGNHMHPDINYPMFDFSCELCTVCAIVIQNRVST